MKSIHWSLATGLVWLLCMNASIAGEADSIYSQSYTIIMKGKVSGTETVTEKQGSAGELISTSDHEIYVTDNLETKRMTFSTKMVLSKTSWTPVSYLYRYTSGDTGDSYSVVIKDDKIARTLNKGGRTSEVTVPFAPDMVIVDHNVYHHYDYLIRKYDAQKGGRQVFADFMPVIGNDIQLAVTFLGNETLESGKWTLPIKKYRVEFVDIWSGTLSMDANGRLVSLDVPAQDLQVIRKDLFSTHSIDSR